MTDIARELLEAIRREYQNNLMKDRELTKAAKKVEAGTATYIDAENYAYHAGKGMSLALQKHIAEKMDEEAVIDPGIAEQIMVSMLAENYKVVSGMTIQVQTALNQAAGLGLKALAVDFDKEMARDLAGKLSGGPLRDTKWTLGTPVISNSQYIVDKSLKKNAAFHAKTGMRPRIIRKAEAKCCAWCSGLEGVYEYGSEPQDIYKRHANCRCTVDYKPDDGKRQNVWSKEWHEDTTDKKIRNRMEMSEGQAGSVLTSFQKDNIFTTEELRALLKYKSFESYRLNELLRSGVAISELDDADQTWISNLDRALEKAPHYSGNLVRAVEISDSQERLKEFLNYHQVGEIVEYKQYISTSFREGYNDDANVYIYIENSTKGRNISGIGMDEGEVVYQRKAKFKVYDKVLYDGKWYIRLQEA